ncbi:6299_t:CDS:2, partial [Gigaspora margarita]
HKIAQEFMIRYEGLKLDRFTVSKVLKNCEQYKNIKDKSVAKNQFCHRSVKFPRLELAMRTWVQQIVAANMPLSNHLLREKGIEFAPIDFIAYSWNNVSNTTIKNCWNSTGILLNITNSDELEPEQFFMDENDYDTIDLTDDSDLKLYYKIIDKPVTTENTINDTEILAIVHRTFDSEPIATDSEEDEVPPVSPVNLSETINALQLFIQFQEQRESDGGFKPEELNMLRKKCIILKN